MNTQTVSIFLTTYNWTAALKLCIKSILNQNIMPNEIIVADDGSKKETKEIIEELKKTSPIPIVHVWQPDEGYRINSIRNLAIKKAKYEYIIQIDGDIILDKNFIKDHIYFSKKGRFVAGRRKDLTMSVTEALLLDEKNNIKYNLFRSRSIAVIHQHFICNKKKVSGVRGCNMAFWKKDAIAVNGYDEDMKGKGSDDKEFAARLVNLKIEIYNLKFYANCFHLFHGEDGMEINYKKIKKILDDSVNEKRIKCNNGIVKIN